MKKVELHTTLRHKSNREQGFTLVELLVVILVIGILAAIAIPAFMNQREDAARAQVETDVKNAATVMEDAYFGNKAYPPSIPNYNKVSEASRVYTNLMSSGPQNFCLEGTHETYSDIQVNYDSLKGGLLEDGESCSEPVVGEGGDSWAAGGGSTYAELLKGKKALIVYSANASTTNAVTRRLQEAGIEQVDTAFGTRDMSALEGYDIIIGTGSAWNLPPADIDFLAQAQAAGYDILTDGNDTSIALPFVLDGATISSPGGMSPTGNTVTPSFPYIFSETAWTHNDSWRCIQELTSTATVVGNHALPDGRKCATIIVDVNKGQWIHYSRMTVSNAAVQAGVLWLIQ